MLDQNEESVSYIRCADGAHLLEIASFPGDPQDTYIYMSVWSPAASHSWGRFRWAWEALRGRRLGSGEVVLNGKEAIKLHNTIRSITLLNAVK